MTSAKLSVLTFNLYFSKGQKDLKELLPKYMPDIVCLQEFNVDEQAVSQIEELGYELVDYSYSFFRSFKFFSIAIFFNPKTVKYQNDTSISLSRSFYELILFFLRFGKTERTALSSNFIDRISQKPFRICTFHLTAMQSTNKARIKQLDITLKYLKNGKNIPTVVAGDFNYIYRRKVLERMFSAEGYLEATNNILYTCVFQILKLFRIKSKPDYIWYRGLKKIKTTKLASKYSDHFPVLAKFEF